MAANNLGELRALVKDWGNRTDITNTVIDSFINIAQDRANRLLRIPVLEGFQTIDVINGQMALPADYLETKALTIYANGKPVNLERKDLAFVAGRQATGWPKYFARKQNYFLIAPINDTITTADIYYYYVADNLVEDTDTNWFVAHGGDMLLYGALAELALYTKNTEEAAQWEAKFRGAAAEITKMADDAEWSGSSIGVLPERKR